MYNLKIISENILPIKKSQIKIHARVKTCKVSGDDPGVDKDGRAAVPHIKYGCCRL